MEAMNAYSPAVVYAVKELLDISIGLSVEKDYEKLLEKILRESRRITRCDAGTLYLVENGKLNFKILQNDRLMLYSCVKECSLDLPPVEICDSTVAGHCALTKQTLNIADVYNDDFPGIDFSGPRQYDALTGYRTKSMLAVPLEDHDGCVIGVLQLLNAKDFKNNIVPFPKHIEPVIMGIASQAAVAISNMRNNEEIDKMLQSFVQVVATAIDERYPYSANHTRRVVGLINTFCQYLHSRNYSFLNVSEDDIKQIVMAAWFHDMGKIAVPSELMEKSTRLGKKFDVVKARLLSIREQRKYEVLKEVLNDPDGLSKEGRTSAIRGQISAIEAEMNDAFDLIAMVNNANCITNEDIKRRISELANHSWLNMKGVEEHWLTQEETEALTLDYGTLTKQERQIVEKHVLIAERMLEQISFGEKYASVPFWACSHHEFLDGSGYPQKLTEEDLPTPVRILTIMDIFDALTAKDRPYHTALKAEEAFSVLEEMGRKGKIDQQLIGLFKESGVWAQKESLFQTHA